MRQKTDTLVSFLVSFLVVKDGGEEGELSVFR